MADGRRKYLWGVGFFLLAMSFFVAAGLLAVPRNYADPASEDGVLDLSDVDFNDDIVAISPGYYTFYPDQLLGTGEAGTAGSERNEPYGTCRVTLRLPGGAYALSQTTNDLALQTSVDGTVVGSLGTVGASPGESNARAGTLISSFSLDGPRDVELSFQYSGFVRHYAPPTIYLGTAGLIAEQQERLVLRDMLFAGCMLTAGLLFLGMFLFFGHRRQFLCFALICLLLSAEQLITRSMPLSLLVPLDAAVVARAEYLATLGIAVGMFCYIDAVFGYVFQRAAYLAGAALAGAYCIVLLVVDPYAFTEMRGFVTAVFAAFALYCLVRLLQKVRKPSFEQRLVLLGFVLFVAVVFAEQAVLRWILPYRYGNGFFPASAMVGMIFINMIALSAYALRVERELYEARLAEHALQLSNLSLAHRNRLQQELIQTVSHELRTPLAVMSGYAQLSAKKLREDRPAETVPHDLDIITRESDRLALLVSRLLEQDADDGADGEACDPCRVVEQCGRVYEPMLRKRGNAIVFQLADSVPDVAMDQASLTQILLNLLSNASRHTCNGSVEMGVRNDPGEAGPGCVHLWVKDTGEGIDADLQQRIFERRVRGENGGSQGLGLAICWEMVDAHGGTMGVESTAGKGSCIWMRIPAAESSEDGIHGA